MPSKHATSRRPPPRCWKPSISDTGVSTTQRGSAIKKAELRAPPPRSTPQRGSLDLCVELDGGEALFARPVTRAPRATEGHVIVNTCGRQIDHHHSSAHVALKVASVLPRRGDAGGWPSKPAAGC